MCVGNRLSHGERQVVAVVVERYKSVFERVAKVVLDTVIEFAVAIPLYYSTGNRKKAFFYSLASGLAEPFGAFVGFLLLSQFFNDLTFGILFAMVAGIMVFISLDELLPASEEYGEHHVSLYGLISGMLVMAISLIVL